MAPHGLTPARSPGRLRCLTSVRPPGAFARAGREAPAAPSQPSRRPAAAQPQPRRRPGAIEEVKKLQFCMQLSDFSNCNFGQFSNPVRCEGHLSQVIGCLGSSTGEAVVGGWQDLFLQGVPSVNCLTSVIHPWHPHAVSVWLTIQESFPSSLETCRSLRLLTLVSTWLLKTPLCRTPNIGPTSRYVAALRRALLRLLSVYLANR